MGKAKQSMKLEREARLRNIAFRKRKEGLKKKARELSVLCDVQVCLFIYGPAIDGSTTADLEVWPPNPDNIQSLIASYKNQISKDQTKYSDNVFRFLQKKREIIENDLLELRKENKIANYATWDDRYNEFSFEQLQEFGSLLDNKLAVVRNKIDAIKSAQTYASSPYFVNDSVPPQHQSSSSLISPIQVELPLNDRFPQTQEKQIAEHVIPNDPLFVMNDSDSYYYSTSQFDGMTSNDSTCISLYYEDTTLGNFMGSDSGSFGNNDIDLQMMQPYTQFMTMEDNLTWYEQMMKNPTTDQM